MATPSHWQGHYTRRRRFIQMGFFAVFVLLPLFDLFRFDFATNRLHFFRTELWLDEWTLLWLALMFSMWVVGAMSLVFGRVYCAYACPQMLFTELAHDFDALGKKLARRAPAARRAKIAKTISLALIALVSVVASVLFMAYFAPLPEVARRLVRLDVGLWVGVVGATTALVTFLDFAFVREHFCRSACPYGLLQGLLEDGRSLHVAFDQDSGACIQCEACARVCPMDIDIRNGAFQIECTRCGSCIDACTSILGRMKPARPSVLSFRLPGLSWGSLDAKRVLVTVATVGFGVVFAFALLTRDTLSLQLSPVYTESTAGEVAESHFLLRVTNRGQVPVDLTARPEGLPATVEMSGLEVPTVPAGEERRFELVVRLPRAQTESSVTPFVWVVEGGGESERFAAALLSHPRRKTS